LEGGRSEGGGGRGDGEHGIPWVWDVGALAFLVVAPRADAAAGGGFRV